MSKIVIIGAGAMGSAFALPCLDNNHDINIVGTHLENEFIDSLKKHHNLHPGLNTKIPQEIKIFNFEKFDFFDLIFFKSEFIFVFSFFGKFLILCIEIFLILFLVIISTWSKDISLI